jgi:hypothetical protein
MATYVLVHGAWHTGAELEPTAAPIRQRLPATEPAIRRPWV